MKINRENAEHYTWKEICDGWHFLNSEGLSVIAEKMPAYTAEDMHFHRQSRQFFYMLRGTARMTLIDGEIYLEPGEGIEIPPGQPHQMRNDSNEDSEFIVVSAPKAHGDKVIIDTTLPL